MPQVTVYVRDRDIELWKSLERKAEWISYNLEETDVVAWNRAADERDEIEQIIKENSTSRSATSAGQTDGGEPGAEVPDQKTKTSSQKPSPNDLDFPGHFLNKRRGTRK